MDLGEHRLEVKETVNGQARCSATNDIVIRLSPLIVVKIDPLAVQCYGTTNIPLVAHVTGGTGSYSYEWTATNGTLKDADKATPTQNLSRPNLPLRPDS